MLGLFLCTTRSLTARKYTKVSQTSLDIESKSAIGQLSRLHRLYYNTMSARWAATAFYHCYPHVFILAVVYLIMLAVQPSFTPPTLQFGSSWVNGHKKLRKHPIDQLIKDAEQAFQKILEEDPVSLPAAALTYRRRRGRHPPPGFDVWYETAKKANALIPESFFDRIYDDLEPLWGMEPKLLRYQSYSFPHVIRVRNGKVFHFSDPEDKTNWIEL